MNEQQFEAGLSLLIDDMEGDLGDRHEIFMRLRTIFEGMRAMGMPLPDDLVRLEGELAEEFVRNKKASNRI